MVVRAGRRVPSLPKGGGEGLRIAARAGLGEAIKLANLIIAFFL